MEVRLLDGSHHSTGYRDVKFSFVICHGVVLYSSENNNVGLDADLGDTVQAGTLSTADVLHRVADCWWLDFGDRRRTTPDVRLFGRWHYFSAGRGVFRWC